MGTVEATCMTVVYWSIIGGPVRLGLVIEELDRDVYLFGKVSLRYLMPKISRTLIRVYVYRKGSVGPKSRALLLHGIRVGITELRRIRALTTK